AAVPDQVELHVAAAALQLPVALALAVGGVATAFDDRQVGRQEAVADGADQLEAGLEAALGPVVAEQPADAARLAAVPEEEVLVAVPLQARVDVRRHLLAGRARGGVPMPRVVLEGVVGRQVVATAEPPDIGTGI